VRSSCATDTDSIPEFTTGYEPRSRDSERKELALKYLESISKGSSSVESGHDEVKTNYSNIVEYSSCEDKGTQTIAGMQSVVDTTGRSDSILVQSVLIQLGVSLVTLIMYLAQ
jgi:hypothetical protein